MKHFSQACENNKVPILEQLLDLFSDRRSVLEIGSGTGQHAVHFAQQLPHLTWQTSDLAENHNSINAWLEEAKLDNLRAPLMLDANDARWEAEPSLNDCDAVFTANTLHIMSWEEVEKLFAHLGNLAANKHFRVAIYGPFNYNGQFTSDSNAQFNSWLKQQAPHRAIRDFEAICQQAEKIGLSLTDDFAMPANNRLLHFAS